MPAGVGIPEMGIDELQWAFRHSATPDLWIYFRREVSKSVLMKWTGPVNGDRGHINEK